MEVDELLPLCSRYERFVSLREDRLRRDAVHANVVRADLGCKVLREYLDAGLRGRVGNRRAGMAAACGRGRHRDDGTASSSFHGGQEALDGQERRGQIAVDRSVPGVLVRRLERSRWGRIAAGIHHENVCRSESILDLTAESFDLVELREIGTYGHDASTTALEFRLSRA